MNRDDFSRALRALHNLDGDAFDAIAAALEPGASMTLPEAGAKFYRNPGDFFLRCDDVSADALWKWIEERNAGREPSREERLVTLLREADEFVILAYWTSPAGSDAEKRARALIDRIPEEIGPRGSLAAANAAPTNV